MEKRYDRETIIQELAELAFSKGTDAAALAFLPPGSDLTGMDVSMAAEIKVGEKGINQVKLVDRVELIRLLAALVGTGESESAQARAFFRALSAPDGDEAGNEAGDGAAP